MAAVERYLVVARCGMDDVPLYLCAALVDAENFARFVTEEEVGRVAGYVYDLDASRLITTGYVCFDDNGRPGRFVMVKEFDVKERKATQR